MKCRTRPGHLVLILLAALLLVPALPAARGVAMADDAPEFSESDCDCSDLGIALHWDGDPRYETDDVVGLHCRYSDSGDTEDRRMILKIMYFHDPQYVARMIEYLEDKHMGDYDTRLVQYQTDDYHVLIEASSDSRRMSLLYTYKHTGLMLGSRLIRHGDHYLASIVGEGKGFSSATTFEEAFDVLEQHAVEVIEADKEEHFTLQHYDAFSEEDPPSGESRGDLVATLKDSEGRGISGEEVYFFKELYSLEDRAFFYSLRFPETEPLYVDEASLQAHGLRYAELDEYAVDSTDASLTGNLGEAKWNYISGNGIDFEKLLRALKRDGEVGGTVYAVVFDKSPRQEYADGSRAEVQNVVSLPLTFKGAAAIIGIGALDGSKSAVVKLRQVHEAEAREVVSAPCYFVEGIVYFDSNAIVTIRWLNGMTMTVSVREGFLEDGELEYVAISYRDAGLYRWFDQTFGNWFVECTLSLAPTAIGLAIGGPAGALIGGPVSLLVGGIILVYEGVQWAYDPLIVTAHSEILVDLGEESSVYTVEGGATLYDPDDGSSIDIEAGHMATVSGEGEFGEVVEFNESDLDPDIARVYGAISGEEPAAPEATPSSVFDDDDDGGVNISAIVVPIFLAALIVIFIAARRKRAVQ